MNKRFDVNGEIDPEVLRRARQIDPACFKSYSGDARTKAQAAAVELARAQIAREDELAEIDRESRLLTPEMKDFLIAQMRKANPPMMGAAGVKLVETFEGARGVTDGYGVTDAPAAGRYTVDDLDRMRKAIDRNPKYRLGFDGYGHDGISKRVRHREEVLRTFMLNGTTPAELEKAADAAWEIINARKVQRIIEAERDRQNNAQVRVEIGGETPHILAVGLTHDLPLTMPDRIKLRERIAEAITSVIMKFKK